MQFKYGDLRCSQDQCPRKDLCARFVDQTQCQSSLFETTPYTHPDPDSCGIFLLKA